ncbi:MAG: amidohydrolase family protein [Kiritimatiellia bacterium]|nr:D-aminoacylase [Lentisphaerota bacterium]
MYDLKIVNAQLVSGDGTAGTPGEIGVRQGRIAALDRTVPGNAQRTIDAGGHVLCPGFIDLHTHCLPAVNENYLQTGVTLVVGGNCGFSPEDIQATAAACAGGCGPNIAMLIGHNTVRVAVMGNVNRKPTAAELERMSELVRQALSAGAVGLSTGLTYVPGNYTETAEVVALARSAAEFGGYYASHMRDEGDGLMNSVRETAEIGRAAGLPAHVSHLKVRGRKNWGRSRELLQLMDEFAAGGLDVTHDQYPYTASCGRILLLFPAWGQEGGPDDMRARLADSAQRARLKNDLVEHIADVYDSDGERVVITGAPDASLNGKSLADLARAAGRRNVPADLAETVLEIVARFPGQTDVYCVLHGMCEEDVKIIMRHPRTAIGSDAWAPSAHETRPHPRMFGTFSRVLGHYARDLNLFPVEEAVRRMTGLPARRLGLTDRGVLREGAWADLAVFDPATVLDRATFDDPMHYPVGFDYVLVNGVLTIERGQPTGSLPGVFVGRTGN